MPAPALRIPVALDLESLKQQTQAASDRVGETLKGMARAFTKVNGEIVGISSAGAAGAGLAWQQSLVKQALGFSALAAGAVVAFKVIGGVIDTTREKLEEMVAIADKSRAATVSASFFQAFRAEAQKLKVSAGDMEAALTHAFNATKDKAPIDLSKWEVGEERITDVEKALRVYNETLAKAQGQTLQGLVLFRDAQTQDDKVKAVLRAMVQLNSIGQNLAALDIGEKMFGAQFVDRIRQGRTSAESILKTMQDASAASSGLFSDEIVRRAKEIDDQLKLAQQRLDRELKPTWESLANTMLTIKSLWADVVDLSARAAAIIGRINFSDLVNLIANPVGTIAQAIGRNMLGLNPPSRGNGSLAADAGINDIGLGPSRGTGPPPKLRAPPATSSRDRFDSAVEVIEKRTASLDAETRAIDDGTEARNRAKIAAELETVAKQINKEAGLAANVVTEEQRVRINAVADAYGRVAAASERTHWPLATMAREAANVAKQFDLFLSSLPSVGGSFALDFVQQGRANAERLKQAQDNFAWSKKTEADVRALAKVTSEVEKASSAWAKFESAGERALQRISDKLLDMAVTNLVSRALGGLFGSSGVFPDLFKVEGKAAGGPVSAGQPYIVGEGGRPELFVPSVNGTIIPTVPNQISPRGGMGGGSMDINVSIDLTGANGDETIERISAQAAARGVQHGLAQYDSALPGRLRTIRTRAL